VRPATNISQSANAVWAISGIRYYIGVCLAHLYTMTGNKIRFFWPFFLAYQALGGGAISAFAAEDAKIAPPATMNEQVLSMSGDPARPTELVVTVLTPPGNGPFPLIVMNHGSSTSANPEQDPRYRFSFSSYYFLSRGYAVALPMMRGFAGSKGRQIMNGCNQEAVGIANARDIQAVIEFMATQPYVDGEHVVAAGQSFGGWNTLALGTLHPRIRGLINFAGGAYISNCSDNQASMANAASHFGSQTITPSLWIYGDNDAVFSPYVWRSMFASYTNAGGPAELVAYGRFLSDSHNLLGFPEGLRVWAPEVDAFLRKVSMPSAITHPEYLPVEFPPPSNFAPVDDVEAVPYLNDGGRQTYRKFLADPMPKVFVFSPGGLAADFNGGFDPLGRALTACQQHSQKCQIYAVDDYVSWVRPTPAPQPTKFASIQDISAVPYINAAGREAYARYLTLRKPKAFVIAPDGAWYFAALGEDPLLSAMETCKKAHANCRLYGVDDAVVW
jgi:dienelactone hydrolase